ncbi:class I SAM-dependent methyltransferase [Constantimarinum furrinae]|uniref:Methyltransferase domain-containing protein n=1 Tax=Constantimarinum furrinae TaxID=2562285 RepID=A0A7G8PVK2_9FLAO|nr:class I SAM-dependent methyltransferase [Constantimarinum furrinae]QNJ98368.1 Methyltransferase domain-containing protein [Constantimarinum furrinae]
MSGCLLCHSNATEQVLEDKSILFLKCSQCGSIFKHPEAFPTPTEEKERYLLHENDINDPGYRAFVAPVVDRISSDRTPRHFGLDFGAGPGPVIAKLLSEKGFNIALYDPFFYPDPSVLNKMFDFIICCEVIEHFHDPFTEFQRLKNLLHPGGTLYGMTHLLPDLNHFKDWYYKDDPTHVIFYSKENLNWIKKNFGFKELEISDRLIVMSL